MALNKDITLQNGVTCNYHRITELNLRIREKESIIETEEPFTVTDEEGNETTIQQPKQEKAIETSRTLTFDVSHYVSKDIRDTVINSAVKKEEHMIKLSEEDTESNIRTVAYEYLKTLPEYEDARDC